MYWDRLEEVFDSFKVTRVIGVGLEQTGKTNTSFFLSRLFSHLAYKKGSIPIVLYQVWRDPITTWRKIVIAKKLIDYWRLEEECNDYRPDSIYIIIDDMSFTSLTYDKTMRKFLNKMSKIKHYFKYMRRIVIHFIIHYSKASLPFLRIGHIRYVTSIVSPQEVAGLSEYFTQGVLWNFYNMKINHVKKAKYYTLFNIYGIDFISKPPKVDPPDNMITIPNWVLGLDKRQRQEGIYKVILPENLDEYPIYVKKRKDYTDIYLDVEKFRKLASNGLTKKYIRLIKLMNP